MPRACQMTWHGLDSVFGQTCMQPFCLGYLLSSYRKTLEFTRQELPVYLSKSLFPETHDSPNLYLMNGAAEVQMYMCYVPDGMQALDFCIQPYSHQGESSYQLPDGTCMGLGCLQVLVPKCFSACGHSGCSISTSSICNGFSGPGALVSRGFTKSLYNELCLRDVSHDKIRV